MGRESAGQIELLLIGMTSFDSHLPAAYPGDPPCGAGINRNMLERALLLLRVDGQ
jgi:hypothetical protein